MNFRNYTIVSRLAALGVLFLLALLLVGIGAWQALQQTSQRGEAALQRSIALTMAVDRARAAQVDFKTQVQEWKNILLRGADPALLERYTAAFKKSAQQTQDGLAGVKDSLAGLGMSTPLIDEARAAHAELGKNYLNALGSYDSANPESYKTVDAQVKGMDRAPTKKIDDIVKFIDQQAALVGQQIRAEQAAALHQARLQLGAVVLVALALGAGFMLVLARSITRPLDEAVRIARTVASGDLSASFEVEGRDEVAAMLGALKEMHDNLAGIVARVRVGTESIAAASQQIAEGNQDLSNRTEEQAGSLEETASAIEQMAGTVRENGGNATLARELADAATGVAQRGGEAVREVVRTMGSINESSRKIVDIIGVIDGIAFQTNILALNAAVEAARAGEQGRGFAVVASEVRNLAQRSASAAKEIKQLIGDSVEKVDAGAKLVDHTGLTMQEVVSSIRRVTDIMGEISSASQEQIQGIDQVNQAMSQMDEATQQNAALVEEATAATSALQQEAARLAQVVDVFKLGHEQRAPAAPAARPAASVPALRASAPAKRPAPAKASRPAAKATAATADGDWEQF
jgi:methyl-accepting chemotaxis protein-1 (serine sensor receptor)